MAGYSCPESPPTAGTTSDDHPSDAIPSRPLLNRTPSCDRRTTQQKCPDRRHWSAVGPHAQGHPHAVPQTTSQHACSCTSHSQPPFRLQFCHQRRAARHSIDTPLRVARVELADANRRPNIEGGKRTRTRMERKPLDGAVGILCDTFLTANLIWLI